MRSILLAATLLATTPAYGAGLLTCYDGSTAQDHCDWKTAETPQQQGIGPSAPTGMSPWLFQPSTLPYCDTGNAGSCVMRQTPTPDTSWHLLTQSEGGVVSLIKGLSREECETMRRKLDPFERYCPHPPPITDDTSGAVLNMKPGGLSWSCSWVSQPSDIRTTECFQ